MEKRIPVVVIKELSETDKILTALKNNGINCAEITFRTACAKEAIAYACKNYPDMSIGAGTVINAEQCQAALDAGAQFIVSPGLSVAVAKICAEKNVPYYPGCVTPTEIMQALELGITPHWPAATAAAVYKDKKQDKFPPIWEGILFCFLQIFRNLAGFTERFC